MMHMWYWFGTNLGSFLFSGYNVTTPWAFLSTCLGLTALAILYEGMKLLQIKLPYITVASIKKTTSRSSENSSLLSKISPKSFVASSSMHCWYKWKLQALHWFLHTLLGYILMMAIMTYNVYITIALAIGGGIGYWIFGPVLVECRMAHFQEQQRILQCEKECADAIVNQRRRESTVSVIAEQLVTEATVEIHAPQDI